MPPRADLLDEGLEAAAARDPFPLPATEDREGYHQDRHLDYWISGLNDALSIQALASEHGNPVEAGDQVVDLGSASGRVIRQFVTRFGAQGIALDINEAHINWINTHLGHPDLRAIHIPAIPHIPLSDASTRVVYGLSVFTHIDTYELAWLAEVERILAPGGIAYLSVHTQRTWSDLNPDWSLYESLVTRADRITNRAVTRQTFTGPMPTQREVFSWRASGHYACNVFHHTDYLRSVWNRTLEVLDVVHRGSDYQDVVVMRKRVPAGRQQR